MNWKAVVPLRQVFGRWFISFRLLKADRFVFGEVSYSPV